ncbi:MULTISPECIES: TetR/AcrR family transcriptional regulator [Pseudomonas]|uniref:TetR/AcrR family transcriptional regulator n=1 Tax=Pseudomonas TaxID=286 RepID=UPI0015E36262|nr:MULTISPECIES: TetR/AcrR family transcriptional regulator [Pseudomonas]MBA1244308.1 TetR/AcrR family transcriptional regulator [Pseudomonas japonica]MBA1291461.1 TetR/AcrR family transcriptional regulator [Pseudomonas japonica]
MKTSNALQTSDVRDSILAHGQRIMAGKGFSAVGINEVLTAASVPKGSFYHYFSSKDAFGEALLEDYFEGYLAEIDQTLSLPGLNMAERLLKYFESWQANQSFFDCQGKCLAVKLGAEVADLSEAMRMALKRGTAGITERLAAAIEAGLAEGSLKVDGAPEDIAKSLYQMWLGASVMVKINRNTLPFDTAMVATRQLLRAAG